MRSENSNQKYVSVRKAETSNIPAMDSVQALKTLRSKRLNRESGGATYDEERRDFTQPLGGILERLVLELIGSDILTGADSRAREKRTLTPIKVYQISAACCTAIYRL